MLALVGASISLAAAVTHLAIARAPGWESSRRFAWIALSACCYCVTNLVPPASGLPEWAYVLASRSNYLWAHLHMLAWLPFVFGGKPAQPRPMPRAIRVFAIFSAAVGVIMTVTRWHLESGVNVLWIPWAHVSYRYGITTPIGDVYSLFVGLSLFVPFGGLIARAVRGERELWVVIAGFAVFLACAVVEVLVAIRAMIFISPADIGFLAVVVPTFALQLRRFLRDARRLDRLSRDLAGQVAARTEERDRAESALVDAERLAALGQLAAGVGHEINNPLTYMRFALEHVDEHLRITSAPTEVRAALTDAVDGANRIRKVVEGLQTYSRRGGERVPLDLADVVRAALKVAGPQLRHVAAIEPDIDHAPPVLGDEPRLVQALVNLLVNAAQAIGPARHDGRIVVSTYARGENESVLEVRDNGPGMTAEQRAHALEPYFTTRASQGGLGLGLFVTRGIVDAHEGRFELEDAAPGTVARIALAALPAAARPAPQAPVPPGVHEEAAAAPLRLLIVDDEPLVLEMLAGVLASHFEVAGAIDGADALAQLAASNFDVIACDLMMPGLSGIDLAREVEARWPALRPRMIFLTGGAVTAEADEFLRRPDVVHLLKPLDLETLVDAIRAVAPGPLSA